MHSSICHPSRGLVLGQCVRLESRERGKFPLKVFQVIQAEQPWNGHIVETSHKNI